MTRRKFDRYMVVAGAGRHVKFARLTDSERCAHFLGVLSIAAQAPIRGCLLVGEQEAGSVEVAQEAAVTEKVAASTLEKLKLVGVLERDQELGCWRVHDWGDVNPTPKSDATNAERQQRYRERRRESNGASNAVRNGGVTPRITPTEVEVEEEPPQSPPEGGVEVQRLDDARERLQAAELRDLFDYWRTKCGHPDAKLTEDRRRKLQARRREGYTVEQIRSGIDGAARAAFVNDTGKRFDDLALICRTGSKLEDFIARSQLPDEPRGDGFGDRLRARNLA